MTADRRARRAPKLDLTGHPHGFAIRFGGEVVDVFPTWDGAVAGLRAARAAMAQLTQSLKQDVE